MVLVEADEEHQPGHEQHAAADAEQAGDHAAGEAEQDRADHLSTSSTALPTSTAANISAIARPGMRWASHEPSRTPAIAGTPTSAASPTRTFPSRPPAASATAA